MELVTGDYRATKGDILLETRKENHLQIFENSEFGQLSVLDIDGKTYFPATECAKLLGYSNPHKAIGDHCKGVTKREALTQGGQQTMNFIPEGDLYRLITHSKLPSAERFESWVFDEVLPSIRKHGMYAVDELLGNPDMAIAAFTALKKEREKNKVLCVENAVLTEKTLTWDYAKFINAAVRMYSKKFFGAYHYAWNSFKKELLYKHGININSRITFKMMASGKATKPPTLSVLDEQELVQAAGCITALCKESNIDISELLRNVPENLVETA